MAYTYTPLLTVNDFNSVSQKLKDDKFDNSLRDAQENRLSKFLGPALYLQLVNNIADGSIYQELWEGKVYQNSQGEDVQLYGLRQYLINVTLHIYFKPLVSNIGDTFGLPENENIAQDLEEQRITAAKHLNVANNYRTNVIEFLDQNTATYTLWKGADTGRWTGSIYRPR